MLLQGVSGNIPVMQGEVVNCLLSGQPDAILLLATGDLLNPGPAAMGAGFLNLQNVNSFLANGFVYAADKTDATGQFGRNWQIPWLAGAGVTFTAQALIEDANAPMGFTLSAASTMTVTNTAVVPQHLFFDPVLSAKGVESILPPAGTLPGDLPTLNSSGFPGPTDVFWQGQPVHGVFQSPFFCHTCHGDAQDIWPSYMGTMMANAARDPLFNGQFAISVAGYEYLQQNGVLPAGGELAADFCIRCHSPNAWQGGRSGFEGDGIASPYSPGIFDHQHSLDQEGVLCDTCHRTTGFVGNRSPTAGLIPGQPDAAQLVISHSTTKRGPYSGTYEWTHLGGTTPYGAHVGPTVSVITPPVVHNPPAQAGTAVSPGHDTQRGANLGESTFCGSCHNITNPASGHAIERTYTEWLNSDYGTPGNPEFQTCQSCHMPAQSNAMGCTIAGTDPTYGAWNKIRSALRQHEFVGGNAWIPQILKQMYPNVDLPWTNAQNYQQTFYFNAASRDAAWDTTSMRATQKLRDAAEVDLAAVEATPGNITATVTVTNLTGHKLPTGYPEGRQMWLQVEVLDANEQPVYQSGVLNANSALIRDADIKIYEAKHALSYPQLGLSGPSFHFALNNRIYKDNRILPKGAVQVRGIGGTDSYHPTLAPYPVGGLYPDGQHWDTTTYSISVPPGTPRPLKVRATALYQTASWEYVDFLANGGDATVQTMPHADALTLRNFWQNGYPAPALGVGVVGASSTPDPQSNWPGQTAMVVLP